MDETEWIRRLQAGDISAFDPLFARYAEPAARTAYLITGNHPAAEDVVQDAFVEVLKSISALRDPSRFRSWFYRIVINKAKRQVRPRRLKLLPLELVRREGADTNSVSPDEAILGSEMAQALWQAINSLVDMYRLPLVLRYYTRLSDAEIAEIMEIPAGTVKSRLAYARKLLHDRLILLGYGNSPDRPSAKRGKDQHGR